MAGVRDSVTVGVVLIGMGVAVARSAAGLVAVASSIFPIEGCQLAVIVTGGLSRVGRGVAVEVLVEGTGVAEEEGARLGEAGVTPF